jgi:multiple sugar transport system ATP-binding protein
VALARALVREPTVFLLDEPLSNLDAKLRASAREELSSFHRRVKTTTVYVTHDQVEAMAMGDRIVVLHQGVVRQVGAPREVYDEPADTFVATFLGSPPMNLVEIGDVVAGFRPETLQPEAAVSGPKLPVSLRIQHVEYLGSERILYAVGEGGTLGEKKVVARLTTATSAGFAEGGVHPFAIAERDLKFFEAASGKRTTPRGIAWR